ncbi:unnamed protein product [Citrullus colocynthis]|uniref:Uncharacterized protein n=1 Tax=Citrullus colocynthis TaxID=252529 RepID=A0ABP0XUD7_9ROSI
MRSLLQKWFHECRSRWSFECSKFSTYMEDMIRSTLEDSRSMNVYPINWHEIEVHDHTNQFIVDILNLLLYEETCPMGNIEQFTSIHGVGNGLFLPPDVKRLARRPKKKNFKLA